MYSYKLDPPPAELVVFFYKDTPHYHWAVRSFSMRLELSSQLQHDVKENLIG